MRDENACCMMIGQYKDMVFRICMSFVNNREDAEELTQDVFINAINNISSFKKDAVLQTWIYRIAINQSLNIKRKQKKTSLFERLGLTSSIEKEIQDQDISLIDNSPETLHITEENNKILYKCIDSLKENQRIAFTLNKVDHFSYTEVAEIMKISVSSVETLIHRAKKQLQEKLVRLLG